MQNLTTMVKTTPVKTTKERKSLFLCQPVNHWITDASKLPTPEMLFSEFWFEGELCILFADTNLGKSILATQIAESISKGEAVPGFKLEAKPQPVLYIDFELSPKQWQARYSDNYENPHEFSPDFFRAEIPLGAEVPNPYKRWSDYLMASIEEEIRTHDGRVVVIDNLTFLAEDNERAKDALPLMKALKSLKEKYALSMLVLAHTPKREMSRPLTKNDLQGSKMLMNFCDSSFAIGESSTDPSVRYLKQIKHRNCEQIYGVENVCDCILNKGANNNFLQFEFIGNGSEYDHLKELDATSRENRILEAKALKREGMSNVSIAAKFGVSEGAVRKWVNK